MAGRTSSLKDLVPIVTREKKCHDELHADCQSLIESLKTGASSLETPISRDVQNGLTTCKRMSLSCRVSSSQASDYLWMAELAGERGLRTPEQRERVRKGLVTSLFSKDQQEFQKYRRRLGISHERLKEGRGKLLQENETSDLFLTRQALRTMTTKYEDEEKTQKRTRERQVTLWDACVVVLAIFAMGCIITATLVVVLLDASPLAVVALLYAIGGVLVLVLSCHGLHKIHERQKRGATLCPTALAVLNEIRRFLAKLDEYHCKLSQLHHDFQTVGWPGDDCQPEEVKTAFAYLKEPISY